MKHLTAVSRMPAPAESEQTNLESLVDFLSLFLSLFGTITTVAQSLLSGVVTALETFLSGKDGQ
ncbi:MAG: hypothetical protein JXR94_04765 [Candidatus Hydrogenedentes bacterium]|nr:hypothetical protein [Candidatus Hydrogenedentota bacterium]